jgi:iron complex outermembrane receptor protein/hemoglobin/transferrin/lactoferrin receptor protein
MRVFHPFRAALLLSTAATAVAQAQEAEPGAEPPTVLDIVVTGTPVASGPLDTPADIDVLAGAEKARRQETSLGDSLDHLSGLDTIGTGSQVGKPVIRGFSGNRIRVLSDGVGLDHQQFGVRHPPNVSPFLSERIEVVRGASSILYGSGALGGAVNVMPAEPPVAPDGTTTAAGETTLAYETAFEQVTGGVKAEAAYGPFGISAGFVGVHSDGFETPSGDEALDSGDPNDPLVTGEIPFTDFRQFNGDLNLGYMTDIGQVVLRYEAYRDQHNFVVPDPPPPDGDPLQPGGVGQTLENDTVQLKGDLDVSPWLTLRPKVTFSSNLRVSNPGPPEPLPRSFLPDAKVIDIRRNNWTGRLEAEHGPAFGLAEGRVGVEVMHVDQESRGSTALTPGGNVTNLAAFAFEEARFDRLTLTAGARLDFRRVEAKRGKTADASGLPANNDLLENDYVIPTGSLGASYRLSDSWAVSSNIARGFRAPNLFELYADGVHGGVAAVQQGDPTLDPETSISADAALRWDSETVSAKLTGYMNEISDYIFLAGTGTTDPASGLPVFQVSQQDARIYGADLTLDVTPRSWMNLRGTVGYVDGELDDGTQVPLLPPLKMSAEATVRDNRLGAFAEPYATFGVRYAGSQDSAGLIEPFGQFDSPPPPFGTASTDSYVLADIEVGGRIARTGTQLTFGVENLFDTAYRDFLDTYKNITLGPGRNFTFKLTQSF